MSRLLCLWIFFGLGPKGYAASAEPKIGFDYRYHYEGSDQGFQKTTEVKPSRTDHFELADFKMKMNGALNEGIRYSVLYQLNRSYLERATVYWNVGAPISLSVGTDRALLHGFEGFNRSHETMLVSGYLQYHAALRDGPQAAFEIGSEILGDLTLQLIADRPGVGNSQNKQPAAILQWSRGFGPVTPLVQYGSYDLNRSNVVDLGVEFISAGLRTYLDYLVDRRGVKVGDLWLVKKYHSVAFEMIYDYGLIEPFVKFTRFSIGQPSHGSIGDWSGNRFENGDTTLNDNGTSTAFGFFLFGPAKVRPFLNYVLKGAKVLRNPRQVVGPIENRTETLIQVGMTGTF